MMLEVHVIQAVILGFNTRESGDDGDDDTTTAGSGLRPDEEDSH